MSRKQPANLKASDCHLFGSICDGNELLEFFLALAIQSVHFEISGSRLSFCLLLCVPQ